MTADGEDDERDPFGRLEESVNDREGDPFESLPDATDAADAEAASDSSGAVDAGPTEAAGGAADDAGVTEVSEPRVRPGTPDPDGDEFETEGDDPFTAPGSAFEQLDLGDVDEDAVWEALSAAETRGSVADAGEHTYAEVSKHRFCEGCEHFTGPPRVACTNDGTEILAFVDMERVRVVDCPIVEERRALERAADH